MSDFDTNELTQHPKLMISQGSRSVLVEASKWAKFLGITGYCLVGLIVLISFSMLFVSSSFLEGTNLHMGMSIILMWIFYLAIAVIYFIPTNYLYRHAVSLRLAIERNDQRQLDSAFENLKSLFKFMGIFTIITLGLYLIAIFFAFLGAQLF
jgi:hypothetical protein